MVSGSVWGSVGVSSYRESGSVARLAAPAITYSACDKKGE